MKTMLSVTVPGNTVNELLQHWAAIPDWYVPAFVSVNDTGKIHCIDRKEVYEYAGRFANKLMKLGVKKGSIVCSTLPNSVERIICDMGILLSGGTSLNGQIFRSDGSDFLNSLRVSKAEYIIIDPNVDKDPCKTLSREGIKITERSVKCASLPHLRQIIYCQRNLQDKNQDFLSILQNSKSTPFCATVDPSDIATIMTTSGSTGYSKLVKLSHANLCHFCVQVKAIEPFHGGDRFMNCAPLGWAGGFPQWYLGLGVTRYFIDMYDGPPENLPFTVWKKIVQEKIIYAFISPMYVTEILQNTSLWQDSEWKPEILCLAGQPVKKGHLDIIGKLCSAVDINYGTTECNLVTTHRITDPESFEDGCAGYPGHGVTLKFVDKEKNEIPQGQRGEILLKSPSLFSGYLNNDEANQNTFTADGWFCTDDAGYMDSKGRVHVEGRQSDSIIRGAYVLYPGWMEQEIKRLEKVREVVVVAVPDPVLHHEICACIVADVPSGQKRPKNHNAIFISESFQTRKPYAVADNEFGSSFDSVDKSYENNLDSTDSSYSGSSYSIPCVQLESIRTRGMKTGLKVDYNVTKVKTETTLNSVIKDLKSIDIDKDDSLESFEMDIRKFCDQTQILAENDTMRMVPKYYIFWEKFPVTATGKLNRKKIRQLASAVLGLH